MRFFLSRRRQCRDDDMAEEGEEKDREKISNFKDPVLKQLLSIIPPWIFTRHLPLCPLKRNLDMENKNG